MKDINYKIKSVVMGHAIADALGVPVEFAKREVLDLDPVTDMRGFGTYNVPAGSWSDDTSMAIAALDSLKEGTMDLDDVMEKFGNWFYQNEYTPAGKVFDVGFTCRTAISNYVEYGIVKEECGPRDEYSNGNGSLMRIYPFSLMAWFDKNKRKSFTSIIDDASALTHAHERSKLACRIYTVILFEILDKSEKSSVRRALDKANKLYGNNEEISHFGRLLDKNFHLIPREEIESTGYVVHTLEAAVWCLLTTDNYRDCVLKAVNLGSDTDTTAAVAGALAGALYGYDSIPHEWLNILKRRDYIESMCEEAAQGWKNSNSHLFIKNILK